MGLFMITVWYPPDKAGDVAKLILKQPKKIPYVTKWRVFNATGGKDGLKAYHLIYSEKGKAEEAMGELAKYFMPFYNIEGFRYLFEPLIGVSDSYAIFGLKWE
jgi:hypothetical protein